VSARNHLPRGLVTFLFTDIEGSTRLAQMLGAGYRTVLTQHRRLLCHTLSTCDGTPLFSEGDSLFVAFSDATAALHACASAQRELAGHEWPGPQPLVRMGLHTGYAEPHAGEYASPEVHLAARISAAAHGGQVLCSGATAQHAAGLDDGAWLLDLGLHRLRGFDARERLFQLIAPGLPRQFPRPRTVDATLHNLPSPLSTFVGRQAERRELAGLVADHRLVTVVGMGGSGKTRLAVEAARSQVDGYPDGVWFVDVAPIADPALVPAAVASSLGLRPEPGRGVPDTIVEYAANRRFLLVMDTCDTHPAAAGAVIGRLLHGSRGARVLTTSREPLGLPGEVVWRIPPMSVSPDPDGGPSEAVDLLLDRAASARGVRRAAYRSSPDELTELGRVAGRLAGLPLAIELAAARLRLLTPAALAARIDDVLGTLDAGCSIVDGPENRHATMEATVGWSYRTLEPRPARLLRELSAFAGPVDLAAIEWLHGEDPLDALAVLVDKSLVQAEPAADGMAYRLLDPIRGYAARQLASVGAQQGTRDRHVAWALHVLERAYVGPDGRPVTLSLYALDPLAAELRPALGWAASRGSARQGLRLAAGLDQWWRERGLAGEGRSWLSRLYHRMADTGEEVPAEELATAYLMHALHARFDGEHVEELHYLQRAEATARRTQNQGLLARVLAGRGATLLRMGNVTGAEQLCRDAILWAHERDVVGDALFATYALAEILWQRRALDEAAELLATARPVEAARPSERGRRTVDMLLGMVALARGDLVAAHDHLVVALRSRMGYGFTAQAGEAVNAFAVRCASGGDLATAARLFGAAQAARATLRHSSFVFDGYWAEHHTAVRAGLGDGAFDAAYAEGAGLSLEEATTLAFAVEHPDLAVGSARFADAS
jgi:predicted ATPase/class 3 adenylate cyclase